MTHCSKPPAMFIECRGMLQECWNVRLTVINKVDFNSDSTVNPHRSEALACCWWGDGWFGGVGDHCLLVIIVGCLLLPVMGSSDLQGFVNPPRVRGRGQEGKGQGKEFMTLNKPLTLLKGQGFFRGYSVVDTSQISRYSKCCMPFQQC